jgi:hypothetical protein
LIHLSLRLNPAGIPGSSSNNELLAIAEQRNYRTTQATIKTQITTTTITMTTTTTIAVELSQSSWISTVFKLL